MLRAVATRNITSLARSSTTVARLRTSVPVTNPWPARLSPSCACTITRHASSSTDASSLQDPQEIQAQAALDQGTLALQHGHLDEAAKHYQHSLSIKESSIAHYNLGVVQYQLSSLPDAIKSFERSLSLSPSVPNPAQDVSPSDPLQQPLTPAQLIAADTHTNLGAAYILSKPPQPQLALQHLQHALAYNPEDGEVCYNLAAVLEATGHFDEALVAFQRSEKLGIDRAKINIRNLGAKILGKMREEEEKKSQGGGGGEKGEGSLETM
ncbi:BZ3500_MvSof-1268-A1-R1_Chr2-3g05216 [Microbotryum saponariae]|uniref:BZ3500_MvSof-1268-A1-R1_Chr2-3g05216 protein n=1 Tax=Microbotryum saponariae TaxID=289078 RepID=A0A2X0K910_9BASI|nr:BZ3500_MvSof-1268-A1-R1_Chr2-3g05216 [Microbotryum saponariae]SDA01042.1 BZ3501_MvSof-1269-A2-R1_Chr2-2g04889 [Microbotryum saponariae]